MMVLEVATALGPDTVPVKWTSTGDRVTASTCRTTTRNGVRMVGGGVAHPGQGTRLSRRGYNLTKRQQLGLDRLALTGMGRTSLEITHTSVSIQSHGSADAVRSCGA